ncbi:MULTISPECIES: AmmeMemoRadiSam system protein A [unclassified Fusibacter]|uniref:AmmeMemoRadiSam system protein A n=1 Tax=unclassified Fusibacter TaxID=2624464 RepID=UPI001013BBAD|nr:MULTISPECIES: AmmeMemoRadiSam system protein A [unclassified Fusibacter]MCK8061549.1 AmmeMemoRadiSam system protein A [Fusibacter sp. A2]NPE23723.1 AmmeMemoRadiSam system protein A [Fusibacter sp. A1]RXV58750.1 AmmeMemoRadiSam system protein A [Fusibacter sp. A1]
MGRLVKTYFMPHPPIVIPEVAGDRHGLCKNTYDAMMEVGREIAKIKPKRIVIISPHGTVFSDGIGALYNHDLYGNLATFGHEDIEVQKRCDMFFVDELATEASRSDIVVAKIDEDFAEELGITYTLDHGAIVPLWFVDQFYKDYDVVHLAYGLLSPSKLYELGQNIRTVVKQFAGDTVLIASGDMSHALKDSGPYDYHPEGANFDKFVVEAIGKHDFLSILSYPQKKRESARECGFRSFCIAFGAHDRMLVDSKVLSYEGPFGVGYMVAGISEVGGIVPGLLPSIIELSRAEQARRLGLEDDYVKLARNVINTFVLMGDRPQVDPNDYAIDKEAHGCFVSIKNDSGLRGCIGTIHPTRDSLIDEIVDNAIKACSEDPRFDPIYEDELADLRVSVDILLPPEPIESEEDLDPQRYGVIVEAGFKRGLLLPMLEGIETVGEQLRIAKSKAGIEDEPYHLMRFKVIRHEADL